MSASPTAAGAAGNSFGADMFGISVGGDLQTEDPATLSRDLDAIASVGSRWVRIDINWAQIQSDGPSSYDWTAIDRVVEGATDRGLNVLGAILYTPDWARPPGTDSTHGPDPATYAAFASRAAAHYSAMGVHAYEIWNEPNIGFWTPKPNPAAYTRVLRAAYPAIKGADPQSTVITGGTSPAPTDGTDYSPVDFLKAIYANGGGGSFDAVAHHPYTWPADPGDPEAWSAWHQMYGTSPSLRSLMIAHGDGDKKIWGTEFGAPTGGPPGSHVSEGAQAVTVKAGYALWQTYEWAGPLFTYEGRDLGTRDDTRENFFGLLRYDYSKKPAYSAYRSAASAVAGGGVVTAKGSSRTRISVRAKTRRRRSGGVKGHVSIVRRSSKSHAGVSSGHVKVRLIRKAHGRWKVASRWRAAKLRRHGRFHRRIAKLRPGVYRVQARYPGSRRTKPSTARSPRFRVAHSG